MLELLWFSLIAVPTYSPELTEHLCDHPEYRGMFTPQRIHVDAVGTQKKLQRRLCLATSPLHLLHA